MHYYKQYLQPLKHHQQTSWKLIIFYVFNSYIISYLLFETTFTNKILYFETHFSVLSLSGTSD
jgi:hypothetical protein